MSLAIIVIVFKEPIFSINGHDQEMNNVSIIYGELVLS